LFYSAIIATMAIILLNACGVSPGASSGATLAGTQWLLTGLEQNGVEQPLVQGTKLTLQFGDGTVGGSAGCNSFGGTYVVNGQNLTISDLRQTLMACDPPTIMQQETRYTTALLQAQSFALQGTTLTITNPGGTLRFTRA